MRTALVCLLLSVTAAAQPADAPRRARLLPVEVELHSLRVEREDVSLALPVTMSAVGLGALLTGLTLDAALASSRMQGPSAIGVLCYALSSVTLVPGFMALVARLIEKGMLTHHIRQLELALAAE